MWAGFAFLLAPFMWQRSGGVLLGAANPFPAFIGAVLAVVVQAASEKNCRVPDEEVSSTVASAETAEVFQKVSRVRNVAMPEQLPATTTCGAVTKASAEAVPATMVSVWLSDEKPAAEAVRMGEPTAVSRK